MASEYCTAQDVIDLCSWPAFGRLSASAQGRLIRAAGGLIDGYCRRPYGFAEQVVTQSFDGRGQAALWLSLRPVKSIMAVTIDGDALDNSDLDAWTFDAATGRLVRGDGRQDSRFAARWPSGSANVVVQYWGGYSADKLPDELVLATAHLVRFLAEQGSAPGVFKSESLGDWSGTLADNLGDAMPPHVAARLVGFVQDDAFA